MYFSLKGRNATNTGSTETRSDDGLFQSFKNCINCNNHKKKKTIKAHCVKSETAEPTLTIVIEKDTDVLDTGHTNAALNANTEDDKTDHLRILELESPIRRSANAYSEVDLNDELDDNNFRFSEFENKIKTKL